MEERDARAPRGWHLDYRITLTVILVLVINTVGIIWGAAVLTNNVERLEPVPSKIAKMEADIIRLQEHDKLMNEVLGELKAVTKEGLDLIRKFGTEQAKRGPRISSNEDARKEHARQHHRRGK